MKNSNPHPFRGGAGDRMRSVSFALPAAHVSWLQKRAAQLGITMPMLFRQLIQQAISREGQGAP